MPVIEIIESDITTLRVDAIVNAANTALQHGGGVAAAIVRRGGVGIQEESDRIGHVRTGDAAVTSAGALPAKFVIHTVGPVWGEGDEDAKLASAMKSTLRRAVELELESIAVPAISAGTYGFPMPRCARILLETALAHAHPKPGRVIFCLYGRDAFETFRDTYAELTNGR